MTSSKNHEVKSIITRKQGFWIGIGLILVLLIVTGNLQVLVGNVLELFTNLFSSVPPINLNLDFRTVDGISTLIFILIGIFVIAAIIKVITGRFYDY